MKNVDKLIWIKRLFMILMDACIVILASVGALIARFDFSLAQVPKFYIEVIWTSLPFTLLAAIVIFYICRMYSIM